MALSKPLGMRIVQNILDIAQHYLVYGTEDCENNFQFYCNPCHRPLCEQCRNEHQKSSETENHEVVPYRQRKRKLPVEKCNHHPSKDIDMNCEDCQALLCSRCAIEHHRGHIFADLETAYNNINQNYLQNSEDMKRDIKKDVLKMKAFMDKIRASIKAEAESIKSPVEKAMSDNLKQANKMEETLLEKLQSQDKTYEEYNRYLENLLKQLQGYLSFDKVQNDPILFSLS